MSATVNSWRREPKFTFGRHPFKLVNMTTLSHVQPKQAPARAPMRSPDAGSPHDSLSPQDEDFGHVDLHFPIACRENLPERAGAGIEPSPATPRPAAPVVSDCQSLSDPSTRSRVQRGQRPPSLQLARTNGSTELSSAEVRQWIENSRSPDCSNSAAQVPRLLHDNLPPTPTSPVTMSEKPCAPNAPRSAPEPGPKGGSSEPHSRNPGPRASRAQGSPPRGHRPARGRVATLSRNAVFRDEPGHYVEDQPDFSSTHARPTITMLGEIREHVGVPGNMNGRAWGKRPMRPSSQSPDPSLPRMDHRERYDVPSAQHGTGQQAPSVPVTRGHSPPLEGGAPAPRTRGRIHPASSMPDFAVIRPPRMRRGESLTQRERMRGPAHSADIPEHEQSEDEPRTSQDSEASEATVVPDRTERSRSTSPVDPPQPGHKGILSPYFKPSGFAYAIPLDPSQIDCSQRHHRLLTNRNQCAPVECSVCHIDDQADHYTCAWCCLRMCMLCRWHFDEEGMPALQERIHRAVATRRRAEVVKVESTNGAMKTRVD